MVNALLVLRKRLIKNQNLKTPEGVFFLLKEDAKEKNDWDSRKKIDGSYMFDF